MAVLCIKVQTIVTIVYIYEGFAIKRKLFLNKLIKPVLTQVTNDSQDN